MSEMLEKVARAMWMEAVPENPWEGALDDDYYDGPGRNTVRRMAIAAVRAMREPDEKMLQVGQGNYLYGINYIGGKYEADPEAAYQLFAAMIDAILSQEEPVK